MLRRLAGLDGITTAIGYILLLVVALACIGHRKIPSSVDIEALKQLKEFILCDLVIVLPVYLTQKNPGYRFPDLVESVQMQLDHEMRKIEKVNLLVLIVDKQDDKGSMHEEHNVDYVLSLSEDRSNNMLVVSSERELILQYTLLAVHDNSLPYFITQAISRVIEPEHYVSRYLKEQRDTVDHPKVVEIGLFALGTMTNETLQFKEDLRKCLDFLKKEYSPLMTLNFEHHYIENEEDMSQLDTRQSKLAHVYSHIKSGKISQDKSNMRNVSLVDSFSKFAATDISLKLEKNLQQILGFNVFEDYFQLQASTIRRFFVFKYLLETIDNLCSILVLYPKAKYDPVIKNATKNLYSLVDSLHCNVSHPDWHIYLEQCYELKNVVLNYKAL